MDRLSPRRLRVLVVDDFPDVRSLLSLLLRLWGYEVRLAADGPEALRCAGEFGPDVVILDVGLPGMDGCEVARRLRRDPRTRGAVLVALTGLDAAEGGERCRAAGFDHHLAKPFAPEALRQLLASAPAVPAR
jgi:CheY-like chemotaxis protein